MSGLRVKSLAVALRLPDGARGGAVRVQETVERRFLPAVLDTLRRELDASFGDDAIIRISRLHLKLRIGPDMRDAADLARQVGRDLAGQVRGMARVMRIGAQGSVAQAEVRVWRTRADYFAYALSAAVRRQPGPAGTIESPSRVVASLRREPKAVVRATMDLLAASEDLATALARLPEEVLRTLADRLGSDISPTIRAMLSGGPAAKPGAQAPASSAPSERSRVRGPDRATPDPGSTPDLPRPPVAAKPETTVDKAAQEARSDGTPRPDRPHFAGPVSPADKRESDPRQPAAPASRAPRTGDDTPARRSPAHETEPRPPDSRASDGPEHPPQNQILATDWGGLPYLLNVAIRLGMPEAIWRIGVPEGAALAEMLAAVSGAPDDPASALLAPEFPKRPPAIGTPPDWARAELADAVLSAMADRNGSARHAPRIETRRAGLAEDSDWRLGDWGAAAILTALEDILERPLDRAAIVRFFALSGEIELLPGLIRVNLPLDAIDLDLRRAGLDANPGHLPWLDRRLEIVFGTGEEEWDH